jgi:hypothetical protein
MEELAVRVRAMQATDKVVIPEAQVLLEQELRPVKAAILAEQVQPEPEHQLPNPLVLVGQVEPQGTLLPLVHPLEY